MLVPNAPVALISLAIFEFGRVLLALLLALLVFQCSLALGISFFLFFPLWADGTALLSSLLPPPCLRHCLLQHLKKLLRYTAQLSEGYGKVLSDVT